MDRPGCGSRTQSSPCALACTQGLHPGRSCTQFLTGQAVLVRGKLQKVSPDQAGARAWSWTGQRGGHAASASLWSRTCNHKAVSGRSSDHIQLFQPTRPRACGCWGPRCLSARLMRTCRCRCSIAADRCRPAQLCTCYLGTCLCSGGSEGFRQQKRQQLSSPLPASRQESTADGHYSGHWSCAERREARHSPSPAAQTP